MTVSLIAVALTVQRPHALLIQAEEGSLENSQHPGGSLSIFKTNKPLSVWAALQELIQ